MNHFAMTRPADQAMCDEFERTRATIAATATLFTRLPEARANQQRMELKEAGNGTA